MTQRLIVELIADLAQFSPNLARGVAVLERFGEKAQAVGAALSVSLSAPIGALGKKALDAYGELDALTRGLATLEKDAVSLKGRLTELQQVAKLPGLGYKEAIQFDVALRSAGFSAELSKRSMMAFGNALGIIGKGKNELKGVSLQLEQLATKTSGFGNDIRIIKEYAPQVGAALQNAFGTIDTEAIADAGFTGKQVVERIVAELEKLPKATGGFKNALENVGDSMFRSLARLGEIIDKGLGASEVLNRIGEVISSLVDRFANLSPPIQKVVLGLSVLAVAVPPILAALGLLSSTVIPAVVAGFTMITGPIGLAVAAFTAAATLIVMHWEKVKSFLLETNMWDALKELVGSGLGVVVSIFGVFANLLQGDWTNLWEHFKNVFKYAWNGITSLIASAVMGVGGLVAKLLSAIGMDKMAGIIQNRLNEGLLNMRSSQFLIESPKVNSNLFEGFQFGGSLAGKDGKGGLGDGKGKKTAYEKALDDLKKLQDKINDFNYRNITVPDSVLQQFKKTSERVEETKAALERLQDKINGEGLSKTIKPIAIGNQVDAKTNDFGGASGTMAGYYANMADRIKSRVQAIQSMWNVLTRLGKSDTGEVQLPGLKKLQTLLDSVAAGINKGIKRPLAEMANDIKNGLEQAAQAALIGMGEVIGNLLAGAGGIDALPSMLLGVLGGLLVQLGEMAIKVGIGVEAIKKALGSLNGVAPIAAGIALVAIGTAVRSSAASLAKPKGYESGGLFTGESMIRVGETAKARMGGGEFVAPVATGANLIGDRLLKRMQPFMPQSTVSTGNLSSARSNFPDYLPAHRLEGNTLLLWYERSNRSRSALGNG